MSDSLFFKKGNILHRVNPKSICFFQANGDYTLAIGEDVKYMTSMGISELANFLINDAFVQVHRSYLLNINKIDSIDLMSSKINVSGHIVPISKTRKNNLLEALRIVK